MEDDKVVFWLKPAANSPGAEALLYDSANSEWVDLAPIELKNFVATVPESYKNMATTTYLPPETNKDKEGPSESQTSHRLHSAHATIRHQFVKELGSGGEAVVNQYINLQDGNYYAGKIISLLKNGDEVPDHGQNSDNGHADALKKRVSEEVRALSKMRHVSKL